MSAHQARSEWNLELFVNRELDDYGLDPYEFRIYARIVRRAGRTEAWESIPKMAQATRMSESRARSALQLLEAAGLIESQERSGYTTLRRLTPKLEWAHPQKLEEIRQSLARSKSHTPIKINRGGRQKTPSRSDTGVVAEVLRLPLSKVTDEGIPNQGNPIKVLPSLPLTPSQSEGELERKRENKTENYETGTTPQPLATLINQPELIGKEEGTTVLLPEPLTFVSLQPEVIGFQPTDSVGDKCSAAGAGTEKICSNSNNSQPPAPTPTSQERPKQRYSATPIKQDWEIEPDVPYPAFARWRSFHYLKQGGHWADAALANARSEIRNNPQRAADLWSQFLEYSKQAADNALAAKEAGMTPTLPSCFVDTTPVTKEQVIPLLEALAVGGAKVALPQAVATPSCTACAPYMSEANSINADGGRATEATLNEAPEQPTEARLAFAQPSIAVPAAVQPSDTQPLDASVAVSEPESPSIQTDGIPQAIATSTAGIQAVDDFLIDYQEQEQNMRRLAQMVKSISKPMPKAEREPQPTNHFEKMRSWLHGSEPALRNEAIAWMYKCQDIEPVFDEYGNPYDFTQIEL